MKKIILAAALLLATGCSENQRQYEEKGVCYIRYQHRAFGLKWWDDTEVTVCDGE